MNTLNSLEGRQLSGSTTNNLLDQRGGCLLGAEPHCAGAPRRVLIGATGSGFANRAHAVFLKIFAHVPQTRIPTRHLPYFCDGMIQLLPLQ